MLELFKFLKSYREYKNKFLREVYVYVNEWHRMIYHPFMFNGFKSGSHRDNNKVPLLLCLNKLSSLFLKPIVLADLFDYLFILYLMGWAPVCVQY